MENYCKYKDFNKTLKIFFRSLIKLFPDISELKTMLSLYKIMKTITKKAPKKYFNELVGVHEEEIRKRNYNIHEKLKYENYLYNIMDPLKNAWIGLDKTNKDLIIDEIIILIEKAKI